MAPRPGRKPIVNFFIMRDMQLGVMRKIIGGMLLATLISWGIILLAYFLRYKSALIYQMDTVGNLNKETVFTILLPSLVVSVIINIVIALFVAMYTSRKHVIPIYRFEKWVEAIRSGNMFARLFFREKKQMEEVCRLFNEFTDEMRERFVTIEQAMQQYEKTGKIDEQTHTRVKSILEGLKIHEQ